MTTETLLTRASEALAPFAVSTTRPAPDRLDVTVASERLTGAVKALVDARWGYLSAITGLDLPAPAAKPGAPAPAPPVVDRLAALYHFCEGAAVVTVRVEVPYTAAELPSVCPLIPSAVLYEQELQEMFGIRVAGLPVEGHLLLPDDWPAGVYPLRKSFAGLTPARE